MAELITLEETEGIFEDTGGVPVSFGGVTTYGHFDHVTEEFVAGGGDIGSLAASPYITIASDALPGIGLDDANGEAAGVNESIVVGDYVWTVRAILPGEGAGQIRLFLSNRKGA